MQREKERQRETKREQERKRRGGANLWHVEERLLNSKLEDATCALNVAKYGLELRVADPCLARGWVELEVLVVERAAALKLTQLAAHMRTQATGDVWGHTSSSSSM